jgi:hypothetical protein
MTYNLSGISANTTGMLSFFQGVNNNIMDGWLGIMFLLAIVVICFMSFITTTNDVRKSIMGSTFIGFIMALLFRAMSLVPNSAVVISLIVLALTVAWAYSNEG